MIINLVFIINCIIALFLFLLSFLIFRKNKNRNYLLFWALAAGFYFFSYLVNLFSNNQIFVAFAAFFVLHGFYSLLKKKIPVFWPTGLILALVFALPVSLFTAQDVVLSFFVRIYTALCYLNIARLITGSRWWKKWNNIYLFVVFSGWGIFNLLRIIQVFEAITDFSGVFGILAAIGLLVFHLEEIKESLAEEERKFKMIFDNAIDAIFIVRVENGLETGKVVEANKFACDLLGYSRKELLQKEVADIVDPESLKKITFNKIAKNKRIFETNCLTKKGKKIPVEVNCNSFYLQNEKVWMAMVRDITERKKAQEEIIYLSFHDKLTGLYNRAYFEKMIIELDRRDFLPLSIIMGDLNGLKFTNDVFGHQEGDKLLTGFAKILKEECRSSDIIARWGGDEFVVLMPCTNSSTAGEICENILSACKKYNPELAVKISVALGKDTKEDEKREIMDVIRVAENRMYRHKLMESKHIRNGSNSSTIKKSLMVKSQETEEHIRRVQKMVMDLGRALRFSDKELEELELLSVLHDIGKIAIADEILLKPGRLTPQEWELIKKHCEIGYSIARASPSLESVAEKILSHHERWDGNGYPRGLKQGEIPLMARIIAIVDAYEAMTSDRPYRKALSKEEAIRELKNCSGTQFDPELTEIFISLINSK